MKWKKCLMSIYSLQALHLLKNELFNLSDLIDEIIIKYNNENITKILKFIYWAKN